ncbi:MAG: GNAT family N-acetyltransferase [Deltaproteobacteria bacterium]|nr:GNAT family N-acetyltransferase [Deltaproteobacteria bacterium]
MAAIRTDRLLLRQWRDEDLDAFAAMNADERVMRHFVAPLTREQSLESLERLRRHFADHGYGLWVLEIPGEAPFIGCVGLLQPNFKAHFTPCVEIGWRLAADYWGQGYAREAATAVRDLALGELHLPEIVSMTTPANERSVHLMESLGMRRDPADDFDHPKVPDGHPIKRHVLYRLTRDEWRKLVSYADAT